MKRLEIETGMRRNMQSAGLVDISDHHGGCKTVRCKGGFLSPIAVVVQETGDCAKELF
jgi:hypothetical protein